MRVAIFDLGGVVLRWDPYAAYDGVATRDELDRFFAAVDWRGWNLRQDAGRPWDEGEAELARTYPEWAHLVGVYRANYDRVIPGEVDGTGLVLSDLAAAGVRLLALTNWSSETFRRTRSRFPVLDRFEGIVVSGEEGVVKPDPAIYAVLCGRYDVDPADAVFVDDTERNVAGARDVGMRGIRFTDAGSLRIALAGLGMLSACGAPR